MSMSVDARHCGKVYVVRCTGRIVAGEEIAVLEAAVNRGFREFVRIVLHVGDVTRVDSSGMGLLVRFLSHSRNRGGDVRLSAAPQFLKSLLQLTKVATILRVYESEDEAIVSFLKEPAITGGDDAVVGPLVLFIDQSPDFCAFVRVLLRNHGYEVLSTCRLHDAKTLLNAMQVNHIVIGPDPSHLPCDTVVASLKSLAPAAKTLVLPQDLKHEDAEKAGVALLRMMQSSASATA